jgi:cyclopropane-fatty-acyl-phospholipid synthase
MSQSISRKRVEQLLSGTGITINGTKPHDVSVVNDRFFGRVLRTGSLGLGESYMDGDWECARIDQLIDKIYSLRIAESLHVPWTVYPRLALMMLRNRLSLSRAYIIGREHYDRGNDLFEAMLDAGMNYSCGYWRDATTLDQAQNDKLDRICRKLHLKPGMSMLDIGCGWGSMCKYAAENYGVKVVGVTVSKEQARLARERCSGLDVDIRLIDYRKVPEQFDRIVSIGMFEHVEQRNYRTYMKVIQRCLKPQGLFLLHTIGGNESLRIIDPWIKRYIFPVGMIPSIAQIGLASESLFVTEHWENFGSDYDRTLMAWHENFIAAWPELQGKYSERFRRMWEYYLLICAGAFRSRTTQLWQIVFSPNGVQDGYSFPDEAVFTGHCTTS